VQQLPHLPQQLKSVQVLARFSVRLVIVTAFAAFGNLGFGRSFAALLLLSVGVCVISGIIRHERLFDDTLTYWDEGALYGLLYALTATINQASS